jgi:oxygen-independent coproporphyrinogen-3 oxidase
MESYLPPDPLTGTTVAPAAAARDRARAGLYVHVPFCAQRCTYCDFSTGSLSSHAVERYLAAMSLEIAQRAAAARDLQFSSVFFGGGTPSALSPRAFRTLWRGLVTAFRIAPDAEITLEANPESVRPAQLDAWRAAGVNRLSMGAQSFDAEELRVLGRIHDRDRPAAAFALARRHGFERLSLDLMFGYPGHTEARWRATLDQALALEPEHVSAYCFIPEPGTPLGDAALGGTSPLPPPEWQADAYALATRVLAGSGYACYETSNFARPGAEARHNLVYWLVRPYLALGPSAHGFLGGERYGNHHAFSRWATALERGRTPEAEREANDPERRATEIMMLGLRLGAGLDRDDHPAATWQSVLDRYQAAFLAAVDRHRLESTPGGWRIPAALRFMADDIVAWIEARARRVRFDRPSAAFLT